MTAKIHRIVVALSALLTGLSALVALPSWEPLGIPATAALIFAFSAAVVGLVATFIREATDPSNG